MPNVGGATVLGHTRVGFGAEGEHEPVKIERFMACEPHAAAAVGAVLHAAHLGLQEPDLYTNPCFWTVLGRRDASCVGGVRVFLTTKGYDHKTPIHTSSEVLEHRFNRDPQLSPSVPGWVLVCTC